MIALIKRFDVLIARATASQLVQNVGALAVVQGINYLIPLVTLPYLARVLGPEEWGRVAWMQIILSYFGVLTDWGFSWSGVRKISALRNNVQELSQCFFASWAIQWLLCAIALLGLYILCADAGFFAPFRPYAVYGAGVIVATVLFPLWLFTGLERMRELATMQLVVRAGAVPLVFIFVRRQGDGPFVIAATAVTALSAALVALLWLRRNVALEWRWPSLATVRVEFAESGAMFFSRIWIVLYTSLVPTVLGAFAGATAVGQYVLADKVRSAAQALLQPVSQALFPRMSFLFAHDRSGALRLLWRSGRFVALVAFGASMGLFVFARPIVLFAGGQKFLPAVALLRWLSPLPLIVAMSNLFGVQIMLPNRMIHAFNRILAAAGILSLIVMTIVVPWRGAEGAVINTLMTELFVTGAMAIYLMMRKSVICGN